MTDHSVDSVYDRSRFCFRCLIDVKGRGRSYLARNRIEWRTPSGSRRFADREGPCLVAKRALSIPDSSRICCAGLFASLGRLVCPASTSTPLMKKKKKLFQPLPEWIKIRQKLQGRHQRLKGWSSSAVLPGKYIFCPDLASNLVWFLCYIQDKYPLQIEIKCVTTPCGTLGPIILGSSLAGPLDFQFGVLPQSRDRTRKMEFAGISDSLQIAFDNPDESACSTREAPASAAFSWVPGR